MPIFFPILPKCFFVNVWRFDFRRYLPLVILAAIVLGVATDLRAQTGLTYAGRPFIRIAQANVADPMAGFISGFGRAQIVGDAVVFVPRNGMEVSGIFSGRGGPLTKIAVRGTSISGVPLQVFHDGFVKDSGSGPIAITAGASGADAIQLTDGTTLTTLPASGAVLPNSGGKTANVIGEPYYAQGELAVIAWNALGNGGGVNFVASIV